MANPESSRALAELTPGDSPGRRALILRGWRGLAMRLAGRRPGSWTFTLGCTMGATRTSRCFGPAAGEYLVLDLELQIAG
jgi:hypothetical protein